jgi:hypothetical protein
VAGGIPVKKELRSLFVFIAAVIGTMLAFCDGVNYLSRHLAHRRNMVWQNERLPELCNTARDAAPIIAAIRKYEKDHGRPPEKLQELVPLYLPALPPTSNVARSINWEYILANSQNGNGYKGSHSSNWCLGIRVREDFCSRCYGFVDSLTHSSVGYEDWFMYYSSRIYPQAAHGGVLEKVGDWGYYHQ